MIDQFTQIIQIFKNLDAGALYIVFRVLLAFGIVYAVYLFSMVVVLGGFNTGKGGKK